MQLINVFTEPRRVFDELAKSPSVLLPFVLCMLVYACAIFVYYQRVDGAWLVDTLLQASGQLNAKQLDAARQVTTVATLKWSALIGTVAGSAIGLLIMGGYYKLAGKIAGLNLSYRHWLSFQAWSALPQILGYIVFLIGALVMAPHTVFTDLQMTHIDPLLVHLPTTSAWHGLLGALDLLFLWSAYLVWCGWQRFGGSRRSAVMVVALPYVCLLYTSPSPRD